MDLPRPSLNIFSLVDIALSTGFYFFPPNHPILIQFSINYKPSIWGVLVFPLFLEKKHFKKNFYAVGWNGPVDVPEMCTEAAVTTAPNAMRPSTWPLGVAGKRLGANGRSRGPNGNI